MNTPKIFTNIASSRPVKFVSKKVSQAANKIGKGIENVLEKTPDKDTFAKKALGAFEPTGSNNSFVGLASIMLGAVVVPRVITAAKRNPDNKEATKDEIAEILFRDLQTIAIILFALKSMNSVIANYATKKGGIPMVNKAYKPLFEEGMSIKDKAQDFIKKPLEKFKAIGKNIVDTINPVGGSTALTSEEYISRYSGYKNIDDIIKLMKDVPEHGGDSKKVFNKIFDTLINQQEKTIEELTSKTVKTMGADGTKIPEYETSLKNAKEILTTLKEVKEKGYEDFSNSGKENEQIKELLVAFFQDKNNALVTDAKKLDGVLRTIALAIESIYLGFGLPALNQKRLEKKYLNENPTEIKTVNEQPTSLNSRHIKAQEIKLYSNFLK